MLGDVTVEAGGECLRGGVVFGCQHGGHAVTQGTKHILSTHQSVVGKGAHESFHT